MRMTNNLLLTEILQGGMPREGVYRLYGVFCPIVEVDDSMTFSMFFKFSLSQEQCKWSKLSVMGAGFNSTQRFTTSVEEHIHSVKMRTL